MEADEVLYLLSCEGVVIVIPTPSKMRLSAGSPCLKWADHCSQKFTHLRAPFVCAGSSSGAVYIWDRVTGQLVATHNAHKVACELVQFNPKFALLASANRTLVCFTICRCDWLVWWPTRMVMQGAAGARCARRNYLTSVRTRMFQRKGCFLFSQALWQPASQ
jgi:hypothetical protein